MNKSKKTMFQNLVDLVTEELIKTNSMRNVEISLTVTKHQKAYHRRQFNELREFNRSMYELGKMTDEDFKYSLQLEYVLEKTIDNMNIEEV